MSTTNPQPKLPGIHPQTVEEWREGVTCLCAALIDFRKELFARAMQEARDLRVEAYHRTLGLSEGFRATVELLQDLLGPVPATSETPRHLRIAPPDDSPVPEVPTPEIGGDA